jgi:hypothetical protein
VDDASTPPRGLLRLRAITVWTRWDHLFADTGSVPLGAFLTSPALGANTGFGLAAIETQIAAAAASPFTLSLGRSRFDATGREEVVPIGLEYGVTDRFAVGVTIPIVRRRVMTQFRLDTTGSAANVGPNPGRTSTTALATNANVQSQFSAAASQLQSKLTSCQSNPAGSGCAALLARQSEVAPLVTSSTSFAQTLAGLYGNSASGSGAAFVPTSQSAAQAAIALRVADFNTKYKDLLSTTTDLITAIPVAAGGPAGPADFQNYVVSDLGRDSLNTQERVGIGDIEVGAKMRVLSYLSPSRTRSAQLAVAASVRLPTGSTQSPSEIVDMRLGNGVTAVDGRVFFDGQVGRFGLLTAARFATLVGNDTTIPRPYGKQRIELDLAPRFHISAPFALHGAYTIRTTESEGDQLVGGGVTYSTLAAYRGTGALPIEMRFTHLEAIKGGATRPKFFRDQIEVRIYRRLR